MILKPPGEYVTALIDVQHGDFITIENEGEYRTLPQDKDREVLTFKVKVPSGEVKLLSINATSQKELMTAWGMDSTKWVGKQAKVKVVKQMVFNQEKDVIYLSPVESTVPPVKEEEIPVQEEPPPEEPV